MQDKVGSMMGQCGEKQLELGGGIQEVVKT